jgi:hypothetical protein
VESLFTLEGSDLIKEMGWDKRTDLPASKKLNELAKTAYALGCLAIKATWVEGNTKKVELEPALTPRECGIFKFS